MNEHDFSTLQPILSALHITLHNNVTITTQEVQEACVKAITGFESTTRKAKREYTNAVKACQQRLL